MKKKIAWIRILSFFGVAVFASVLVYQLAALKLNEVSTETVVEKTEQETISARIFVVRDENYIINNTAGTIVPLVEDGKKVAVGDIVAAICGSASDASVYMEKEILQDDISRFNLLKRQQNENALDIEKIDEEANRLFIDMLGVVSSGKLENLKPSTSAFRDKLTSRQITIDGSIDFSKKINSLEKSLAALENKKIFVNNLVADKTGYYISEIDGYENIIPFENIESVSASAIEKAVMSNPAATPTNALGKLVCNYNWYMLASLKKSDAVLFKTGQSKKINFGPNFENSVSVKVYSLNPSESGNTSVVFVCNLMNEQLAGMRIEDAQIVLNEYKGYRINSDAVRVQNGVEGAYVLLGNVITFRRFETKYSNKDYYIIDIIKNTSETKKPYFIELYDEAVIKGKNLREGRVVG